MHPLRSCGARALSHTRPVDPGRCIMRIARRYTPSKRPDAGANCQQDNAAPPNEERKRVYLPVMFTCDGDCLRSEVIGVVGSHAVLDEWRTGKVSRVLGYHPPDFYHGRDHHWIGIVYLPEGEKVEFKYAVVDKRTKAFKAWRNYVNNGNPMALVVEKDSRAEFEPGSSVFVVLPGYERKLVGPGDDPNYKDEDEEFWEEYRLPHL